MNRRQMIAALGGAAVWPFSAGREAGGEAERFTAVHGPEPD